MYQIVGPFWRQMPTTSTTWPTFAWCYLWLNESGNTVAIEWLPW